MKLTIIVSDGAVYENDVCHANLSWQGTPSNIHALQWQDTTGWIEFNDGSPNLTIDSLPNWTDAAMQSWTVANTPVPPAPPTAEANKFLAVAKLSETDWATIPDVSDSSKSNPYLTNSSDFLNYRNQIRQIAINPVEGDISWPTVPNAIWA